MSEGKSAVRRCRVRVDHQMSYPDPLIVTAGEKLTIGETDTRWPYTWCVNQLGKGGWIPESYLVCEVDGDSGRVLHDFDTVELTVAVGEKVAASQEEGGWLWCTNRGGMSGWVPAEALEML